MVIGTRSSKHLHVPASLVVLAALVWTSVVVPRSRAAVEPPEAGATGHHARASQLISGRAIAFALTFDQVVSHSGSRLSLVTPSGVARNIPIRLSASTNALYASVSGLGPGNYILQWDAQTANGTTLRGSLPFKVGEDGSSFRF